jgi:hypothetical protein
MAIDKIITHRPDLGPGKAPPGIPAISEPLGVGDAVAFIATPIARVLHMPCIDPATKQLRPESGCAKRKAAWNAAIPDVRHPFSHSANELVNTPAQK